MKFLVREEKKGYTKIYKFFLMTLFYAICIYVIYTSVGEPEPVNLFTESQSR